MEAQTAQQRVKQRLINNRLVRRSPTLSLGAKILWYELSEWAWDELVCFPSQDVLIHALNVSRQSVSRWVKELVENKLLTVKRNKKGNTYHLAEYVPKEVCESERGVNMKLIEKVRRDKIVLPDVTNSSIKEQDAEEVREPDVTSNVTNSYMTPSISKEYPLYRDEVVQGKLLPPLFEGTMSPPGFSKPPTSRFAPGDEVPVERTENQKQRSYDDPMRQPEDIQELMEEEPLEELSRQRKGRNRRTPSSDLVDLSGEDRRTASQAPREVQQVPATPIPPLTAERVLELLRGEVREKYGVSRSKGIRLNLTSKQKGQIRRTILTKYSADVVMSMVRVLVWDWEVARRDCFPPYKHSEIPEINALSQYRETLASAISSGLTYSGDLRGSVNTYHDRYIEQKRKVIDDDPF